LLNNSMYGTPAVPADSNVTPIRKHAANG
jgi:hypothetical protein